jgi:undecaprenyl diphosphate synthase
MNEKIDPSKLPVHIAIIMDGNGRWARKRGLPRIFGHRQAMKNVKEIVTACAELKKIKVLTLYALSTENWIRPKTEIKGLMSILKRYLVKERKTFMDNNIRLVTIGDSSKLPAEQQKLLDETKKLTEMNSGMVLSLALNYGGRQDILNAVNALLLKGCKKADEKDIADCLYTAGLPDPDLLIRTSGEMRVSNFLLWQIAYTELYVTSVLWPDFKTKDLNDAIIEFQSRQRRFGGI